MTGRKMMPTALKVLKGNPGKRRLPENEPKPAGVATMPQFLKGRPAAIWREYSPELIRLGLLTSVDGHMFAIWCGLAAEFEDNPILHASRIAQLRALASSFGLEPGARARLSAGGGGGGGGGGGEVVD